jgi:dienelactone hydrolase
MGPGKMVAQFLEAGHVCAAFDYSGFGTSDGEGGRMFPKEEISDVLNSVTFLKQQPQVNPRVIGLLGWVLAKES